MGPAPNQYVIFRCKIFFGHHGNSSQDYKENGELFESRLSSWFIQAIKSMVTVVIINKLPFNNMRWHLLQVYRKAYQQPFPMYWNFMIVLVVFSRLWQVFQPRLARTSWLRPYCWSTNSILLTYRTWWDMGRNGSMVSEVWRLSHDIDIPGCVGTCFSIYEWSNWRR